MSSPRCTYLLYDHRVQLHTANFVSLPLLSAPIYMQSERFC